MSESKRVLITGASTGFGYDTAKALAAKGHTVISDCAPLASEKGTRP